MRGAALWLVALVGCAPLTLSHEGVIDFEAYPTVYVEPIAVDGRDLRLVDGTSMRDYLIESLNAESGFKRVVSDPLDARVTLAVSLSAAESWRDEAPEWEVRANFALRSEGGVVARGEVNDDARDLDEALTDTLDEVSLYFLRPYRL